MGFQSWFEVSKCFWLRDRNHGDYPVEAPEELQVAGFVPLRAAEGVCRVVGVGVVERHDRVFAFAWTTTFSGVSH